MNHESEIRWSAVEARDASKDGDFVYGVLTTGVYCRPSCASRKPLRKNVRFFATPAEAGRAGLRPCRRCRPDEAHASGTVDPRIRKACGRSRQVTVVNYGGRAADLWWEKNAGALARHGNLTVLDLPQPEVEALAAMYTRGMKLDVQVQDGEVRVLDEAGREAVLQPTVRMAPAA